MAISKSADVAKTAVKTAAPRHIPAPEAKSAKVVVPKMTVVGGVTAPNTESDTSNGTDFVKKQELVSRILLASGAKKKDIKLILDSVLSVLGDALSNGEELNLPPLGKLKVNRTQENGKSEILILKLRRPGSGPDEDTQPLADDDEDN
jgi:hypothetical protein